MAGGLIGALRATLGLDTAEFEAGTSKAEAQMRQFQREFARTGKRLQDLGKQMSQWVTVPIVGMGVAIAKTAGDFESSMNQLQINANATTKQLGEMRKEALKIGQDTTKSASEAANAMNILAKAGMDATTILRGGASATVSLAEATGSELDPAAAAITDTLQQFKMTAKDLPYIINRITGAVNESKFDFADFQLGMAQAGGVAQTAGMDFKDFTTALAATAYMFQSGSDAGTSFKNFLMRLTPETKKQTQAFKDYGLGFHDAQGNMKSLAEIAQILQDKFKGLDEQTRTAIFKELFGVDAIRSAVALMDLGAKGIDNINAKLSNVDAVKQAEARMKGFNGQLEQLKGALETLAIAIADSGFLAALTDIIRNVAEWVKWVSQAHPETLKWITIMAGGAAAIGPLLVVFGGAIKSVGIILPLLARMGPVVQAIAAGFVYLLPLLKGAVVAMAAMIATPLGLTLTAIAGAVTAVYLAWKHWDAIKQIAINLYNAIKTWIHDKLNQVWDSVKVKIDSVGEWFFDLYDAVVGHSYIPDMVDGIAKHMARLDGEMVAPTKKATSETAQAFEQLKSQVGALLNQLFPEDARANQFARELKLLTDNMTKMGFTAEQTAEAVRRLRDQYMEDMFGKQEPVKEQGSLDEGILKRGDDAFDIWVEKSRTSVDEILGLTKDKTAEMVEAWAGMARDAISSMRGMVSAFKSGDILGGITQLLDIVVQVTGLLRGNRPGGAPPVFARTPTGFSTGGSFKVGGSGGTDSQLVTLRASPGEMINVRRGDQMDRGPGGIAVVRIDKSRYFDAEVEYVAAPIGDRAAVRGAMGGAQIAQRNMMRANRSKLPS